MSRKIIDRFTDLPISGQRKWQLRHPDKVKIMDHKRCKSFQYISPILKTT